MIAPVVLAFPRCGSVAVSSRPSLHPGGIVSTLCAYSCLSIRWIWRLRWRCAPACAPRAGRRILLFPGLARCGLLAAQARRGNRRRRRVPAADRTDGVGPWQEVEYYTAFDRHVKDKRLRAGAGDRRRRRSAGPAVPAHAELGRGPARRPRTRRCTGSFAALKGESVAQRDAAVEADQSVSRPRGHDRGQRRLFLRPQRRDRRRAELRSRNNPAAARS